MLVNRRNDGIDVILCFLTFIPVFQFDNQHTSRGGLSAHHAVTCHIGINLYLRNLTDTLVYHFHRLTRLCQTASRRGRDIHEYGSHILIRHQSGLSGPHKKYQQGTDCRQRYPCHPFTTEEERHPILILQHQPIERSLKCMVKTGRKTQLTTGRLIHVRSHDEGTQSRTEGQGIDCGNTYCHRHGQTKLGIEHPTGSSHERGRDKHSHKYQ